MDRFTSGERIKRLALANGFDLCGIASARPIPRSDYLRDWLVSGRAGTMAYLHKYVNSRIDPRKALPGVRSVIAAAVSYRQKRSTVADPSNGRSGRVAMYAWGEDYHQVVRRKLESFVARIRVEIPLPFETRICVDTSPVVERELAAMAGVGWIGKNTLVLHPSLGSYFFLGIVLTTLELEPDEPMVDHCGTCTACLDACPTKAFPAPYEMDASRCISYWTIEHRGGIPEDVRPAIGDWVFGCDVCQEVCPHNRDAQETREPAFAARPNLPEIRLEEVLAWSPSDYARELSGSAMKRAKREMLQRNARIVLENQKNRQREET